MPSNYFLASDMDGTVIPLDRGTTRAAEIELFRMELSKHPAITLAYVTGRHLELALAGIKRYALPPPTLLVCDVGTSIHVRTGGGWRTDEAYRRAMKRCLGGHCGEDILRALEDIHDLVLQEPDRQAEFKRSYYAPLGVERNNLLARVKRRLGRAGIRANLVYSVDAQRETGLLDILPDAVAKDFALKFLRRKLGIAATHVVYAGDSENDLLAFISGFKSIVVANTPAPVKKALRDFIHTNPGGEEIYFARRRYAAGVFEGCLHFGLF